MYAFIRLFTRCIGVVLATEKRITSVLIEPRSIEKIVEIDAQCVVFPFLFKQANVLSI